MEMVLSSSLYLYLYLYLCMDDDGKRCNCAMRQMPRPVGKESWLEGRIRIKCNGIPNEAVNLIMVVMMLMRWWWW